MVWHCNSIKVLNIKYTSLYVSRDAIQFIQNIYLSSSLLRIVVLVFVVGEPDL
jgi:hypothetical protein